MENDLLSGLNTPQREAVTNYKGASLIIAGAGSGKTRVLTTRIAYMLASGVDPAGVIALTFTNKAADEMRHRIGAQVGWKAARMISMGTFHSIFGRILRAEAAALGYTETFTIYDQSDSRNLIRTIIREMGLDADKYKPNMVGARISFAKNNLVTAGAYAASEAITVEDVKNKVPQIAEIYKQYQQRCQSNNAMDFDDLLLNLNVLFRDHPAIERKYQETFQYVLVDEYQDTNHSQYVIIKRLAAKSGNICVVGDDSQSIYSFRGARIENILNFRRDFPNAKTFKLEQNYRSTRTIVDAANSVIAHNEGRLPKESFSEGDQGEKVRVVRAYTDREEGSLIASDITRRHREGASYGDFAVLYRTNAQSRSIEEALRQAGVPYRIYRGMSFYQRKEIKDLVGYFKLIVNPFDDEALKRIINYPARGIGDVTIGHLSAAAVKKGVSMWERLDDPEPVEGLNSGALAKVAGFRELIRSLSASRDTEGLYAFGMQVATASGMMTSLQADTSPEGMSALQNVEELLNSMQSFAEQRKEEAQEVGEEPVEPTIEEWLQTVALLTDADNEEPGEGDKVAMMTVHYAKGLEFSYVYVPGLEDNLFPNQMAFQKAEGLEEERRLFYVALTRAKQAATLLCSRQRFHNGQMVFSSPSRFLGEIDPAHLDIDFDPKAEAPTQGWEDRPQFGRKPGLGNMYKQRSGEQDNSSSGQTGNWRGGNSDGSDQQSGKPVFSKQGPPAGFRQGSSPGLRRDDRPAYKSPEPPQTIPVQPPAHMKRVSAARPASSPSPAGAYKIGSRVDHPKFGRGTVMDLEDFAGDLKITIDFDDLPPGANRKSLLGKFAKLTVL